MLASAWVWTRVTGGEHLFAPAVMTDPPPPAASSPALWAVPARPAVTWHAHAFAYAAMKWPELSAHSRASLADALSTITPARTRDSPGRRSPAALLRRSLYACAFNPASAKTADPTAAAAMAWAQRASLPVTRLADPAVLRAALDALTFRLDGRRAGHWPGPRWGAPGGSPLMVDSGIGTV